MVSNPSSVGLKGGEVSVGGQQSDLSSLATVAVNLEPATIFFIVGALRLICLLPGKPKIVVPSENGNPITVLVALSAIKALSSETVSVVEPAGASAVTIKHTVPFEPVVGQNTSSPLSIRPLDS